MAINNGSKTDANDILNVFQAHNNVLIGKNGTIKIPVYVNNTSGDVNVKLALWGEAAGASATEMKHGFSSHTHNGSTTGTDPTDTEGLVYTNVPEAVTVLVDNTAAEITTAKANTYNSTVYNYDDTEYDSDGTGAIGTYTKATYSGLSGLNEVVTVKMRADTSSAVGDTSTIIKWTYSDATTASVEVATTGTEYTSEKFVNPNPAKTVNTITVQLKKVTNFGYDSYVKDIVVGTMFGDDGTTEWESGWLDLSAVISWTQGWHYIEIKETGGTGGNLIYHAGINVGTN